MVGNNAWQAYSQDWIEDNYPNLVATGYKVTSPDTIDYRRSNLCDRIICNFQL